MGQHRASDAVEWVMPENVYRPGPLPWAKVPMIGFPRCSGMPTTGYNSPRATVGIIDVKGHVWAMDGVRNQTTEDIRDCDEYHAEYAARKAARGRPEITCQWCSLDDRKALIRTANRRN